MGIEDEVFNLHFTAKQFIRESKRMEKEVNKEKKNCARYSKNGNEAGARASAEAAIRWKKQSEQYLTMGHRVEAVSARLKQAVKMNQVSDSMAKVVKSAKAGLESLDATKVQLTINNFEKIMGDLETKSGGLEKALDAGTASMAPNDEVDEFIRDVAKENQIDQISFLPEAGDQVAASSQAQAQAAPAEDDLDARLAALRAP